MQTKVTSLGGVVITSAAEGADDIARKIGQKLEQIEQKIKEMFEKVNDVLGVILSFMSWLVDQIKSAVNALNRKLQGFLNKVNEFILQGRDPVAAPGTEHGRGYRRTDQHVGAPPGLVEIGGVVAVVLGLITAAVTAFVSYANTVSTEQGNLAGKLNDNSNFPHGSWRVSTTSLKSGWQVADG